MARGVPVGRRKLEIRRIQNEDERLITFSKRKSGIYKKSSEISILTGTEVGILIFSPSQKPYTFGSPKFECIVNRFRGRNYPTLDSMADNLVEAFWKAKREEVNYNYDELYNRLHELKREGERLSRARQPIRDDCWWEVSVNDLNASQMEQFRVAMEHFKELVANRVEEIMAADDTNPSTGSSASSPPPGSSSTQPPSESSHLA